MNRRAGLSALVGIIELMLVPVVSLFLLFTLIGLPLGAVLLALFSVGLLLANVFVAYLVGGWLLNRPGRSAASPYARLILGALLLSFCTALPWIGWFVLLIVLIVGLGAFTVQEWSVLTQWRTRTAA